MKAKDRITVHQAYYGEVGRSHSCIMTSIKDDDLHAFLTRFTDRPGAIPSGHSLAPYYSGIQYGIYYILTLTNADPSAERGGMVFTHALIVLVEDIEYVHSLNVLFGKFLSSRVPNVLELSPLEFPTSMLSQKSKTLLFRDYVRKSVGILTESGPPLLFSGSQSSMEVLVADLWTGLPVSLRKKMSFTTAFSVDSLDSKKTILYFQPSLALILQNQTHVSDQDAKDVELTDDVEKFILTSDDNNHFESFLASLNVEVKDWTLLKKSIKAYQGYQLFLEELISPDQLKSLIRTIVNISPDHDKGQSVKMRLVENLKEQFSLGKDRNIKSLRNFPVGAILKGKDLMTSSIAISIALSFGDSRIFNEQDFAELCALVNDANEMGWWETAVQSGLESVIEEPSCIQVTNLWKLLQCGGKAIEYLFSLMAKTVKLEELLLKDMPTVLLADTAQSLTILCAKNGWLHLHAYLLLKYNSAKDAVRKQLSIDVGNSAKPSPGMELLLSKISDQDLLTLVLEREWPVLTNEFAVRAANNPGLLEQLDFHQAGWLDIWESTLEKTQDLKLGIVDLPAVINVYLDQIISSRTTGRLVFKLMTKEGLTDLSNYHKRGDVWKYIPTEHLKTFISATTSVLAEEIANGSAEIATVEKELLNEMKTDRFLTQYLEKYKEDISLVLSLYEKLPGLKDTFLADYVRFYRPQMTNVESIRLGRLIDKGNLSITARQVFEKAKHRDDLRPALSECNHILNLNFLEKLFFSEILHQKVSYDDLYNALIDIALKLYYQGPEQDEVWKRAGGDVGKLYQHKTREENWRHAIGLLRTGNGGKNISVKSLLEIMMVDSPRNGELKELYKYFRN